MSFHVQTVVTEKCNLDCKYCYMNKRSESMTMNTFKKCLEIIPTLSKAMGYYSSDYSFFMFGGEPLIESDLIFQIKEAVKNKDVYIQTNGLLLNNELVKKLQEKNIGFGISFDGLWNDNNRVLPNGESSLKKYDLLFDYMRKHGTKVVLDRDSLPNLIENYHWFNKQRLYNPDFSINKDANVWTENDVKLFKELLARLTEEIIKFYKDTKIVSVPGLYSLYMKDTITNNTYGKRQFHCFCCNGGCSPFPNGCFYPCARFGSNRKYVIADTNTKEIYQETIDFIHEYNNPAKYEGCDKSCPIYKFCNGGCFYSHLENGDFKKPKCDENLCEIFRTSYKEAYKLYNYFKENEVYNNMIFGN